MEIDAAQQDTIDTIEYDGRLFLRGRDRLPLIMKHWRRTEKYLRMIRDLLQAHGIECIMTMHPYGIHVGPEHWSSGRVFWGFEQGKTYDDYFAYDIVQEFAARSGIMCINTLDAFLAAKDKKLFFDYDGHLTPHGNKVFADYVAENEAFQDVVRALGEGNAND